MQFCRPVVVAAIAALVAFDYGALVTAQVRAPTRPGGPSLAAPAMPAPIGPARKPDVIYLPTKADVVARMLGMAQVRPGDVVFDLGSGDGRIVIQAVRDFSASFGVGVELDPQLIQQSIGNATRAGVIDRVHFLNRSFFDADLSSATVVTLYLLPEVNQRLAPMLRKLKPGTRIVSHDYGLSPDWPPDEVQRMRDNAILLFTVRSRGR